MSLDHLPDLPEHASAVAVEVLSQLAAEQIPPEPPAPTLPELPEHASAVAIEVLSQIAAGQIPPEPPVEALSPELSALSTLTHNEGMVGHWDW